MHLHPIHWHLHCNASNPTASATSTFVPAAPSSLYAALDLPIIPPYIEYANIMINKDSLNVFTVAVIVPYM